MSGGYYDVAQVCVNGHVVNDKARKNPEYNAPFCDKCGGATIICCTECASYIQGDFVGGRIAFISSQTMAPPSFCPQCGHAHPWTDSKIKAAIEMFAEEVTDAAEQKAFQDNLNAISKDTPQVEVAAVRIRKQIAMLGKSAGVSILKMVVDVAAEAIKKSISG